MSGDESGYRVRCGDGKNRCGVIFATEDEAQDTARRLDAYGAEGGTHTVERVS